MSKLSKAILISVALMAITNPWSVLYIDWAVEVAMNKFMEYSVYILVASILILIGASLGVVYMTRPRTKIPAKSKQTKSAGKFLEEIA